MADASIQDVRKYLDTPEKPLEMAEFKDFWASLTNDEKAEYKKNISENQ